jgi:hypothetical protein
MEAPKFNLNKSNIGFESQEALQNELDRPVGKNFDKGNYDGEIVTADFHKNKDTGSIYCDGDPTWFNVKVTLQGADDRTANAWIQVPTSSVRFGKKGTLFVFKKFVEFMSSIGVTVTLDNLDKVVPKYFSNPSKTLTGLKANFDIGYEGAYVERDGEGSCRIVRGGKPVENEDGVMTFPDFASAKACAEAMRIAITYPSIVKWNAAKKTEAKTAADNDW